jgi:hypothetical protein
MNDQQDGTPLWFNKMAHHDCSTRWSTTVLQQDGAPLSFNIIAQHYCSTKLSTTVIQQDGAPPHFYTGPTLFSHSATQKENWTHGTS